jgi:hypothetical protein
MEDIYEAQCQQKREWEDLEASLCIDSEVGTEESDSTLLNE